MPSGEAMRSWSPPAGNGAPTCSPTSNDSAMLLGHVLGLRVDWRKRTLRLAPPDLDLPWCRARLPIGGRWLEIGWRRENGTVIPEIGEMPTGWQLIK